MTEVAMLVEIINAHLESDITCDFEEMDRIFVPDVRGAKRSLTAG